MTDGESYENLNDFCFFLHQYAVSHIILKLI